MLNEILKVFRRSVAAFRDEVGAREPEDQVAALLAGMRRELVAAKAAIPAFEASLGGTKADLLRERSALEQCERRGVMANRIGDVETARVAEEFAVRHRERVVVLEQKVAAAEAELAMRRGEAQEMMLRYREADANRFALLAQIRRAGAKERMRTAASDDEGAFADWNRMQSRVDDEAAYVDALGELDSTPSPARTAEDPATVEARLQELKRRMGRGG
jgi:phage shock protein A